MSNKKKEITPTIIKFTPAAAAAAAGVALTAKASIAADGTAPADVTTAVDEATATAKALGPLALVCLGVALTPWASMLTLRFINMVLSRV